MAPNYRSLIGGYYANPNDRSLPVSIRANNPGAVNGASWERSEPGYVTEIKYDGKNNTTIFETPEQGVAVYWKLLQKYRDSGTDTVGEIIHKYGGGQDYSGYLKMVAQWTGFGASKPVDLEDDSVLLPFAKAMFRYEAGRPIPWSDAQILYGFDLARGNVRHPTKPPIPGKVDFTTAIPAAIKAHDLPPLAVGDDVINIVYVAGVDPDGTPNKNRFNAFDDLRMLVRVKPDGTIEVVDKWEATIETGRYYTEHPIAGDGKGAARIKFGYWKSWQVGLHRGYEALAQTGDKVGVYRDNNKDYSREGDPLDTGYFGINQHHGGDAPRDNIGYHSAGCLVGRTVAGHQRFMQLIKTDRRYQENKKVVIDTWVLPVEWLQVAGPLAKPAPKVETPTQIGAGGAVAAAGSWLAQFLFGNPFMTIIAGVLIFLIIFMAIQIYKER